MRKIKCIIFIFLTILIALSNVTLGAKFNDYWGDEENYPGINSVNDFYCRPYHEGLYYRLYQGEKLELRYSIKNKNNVFYKKIKSLKITLTQRSDIFEKWERDDIFELYDGVSIKSYEEDCEEIFKGIQYYCYFIEFNIENPLEVTDDGLTLMKVNTKIRDDAFGDANYFNDSSFAYLTLEDDEKTCAGSTNIFYILTSQTKPNDTNIVNNTVNNVVNNTVNNTVRNIVNNTVVNRVENRVQNDVVPDSPNNPPQNPSGGETDGAGNDQTISNDNLPFTGYKAIIIPIIVIAIIGYTFYRKYEKYNY